MLGPSVLNYDTNQENISEELGEGLKRLYKMFLMLGLGSRQKTTTAAGNHN